MPKDISSRIDALEDAAGLGRRSNCPGCGSMGVLLVEEAATTQVSGSLPPGTKLMPEGAIQDRCPDCGARCPWKVVRGVSYADL
jgi:hypothetical protein